MKNDEEVMANWAKAQAEKKKKNRKIILIAAVGFIVFAIIGNLLPKAPEPPRNFAQEGSELIQRLREPQSMDELRADYVKAEAFFNEMKQQKDSSDAFAIVALELEALITYKENNIKAAGSDLAIKKQFSEWDGSNRLVERAIKESMNNPKSYEHVKTKYNVDGTKIHVYTTFRGTNAFNAIVTTQAYGITDFDGSLLKLEIQ